MKTTRTKFLYGILAAAVLLAGVGTAYGQLLKTQNIAYTLNPTETATVQNIALGTLTGGSSGSENFNNVLTLTVNSGSHTATAAMTVNDTSFASLQVYVISPGGQVCELAGGSSTSTIGSCSWSVSSSTTYSETIVYQANDGVSYSGKILVAFTLS
jgi:hypothetical protein